MNKMRSIHNIYSFRFLSFIWQQTLSLRVKLAHSKVLFRFDSIFTKCVWFPSSDNAAVADLEFKTFYTYILKRPCYLCPIWKNDITFVNITILWIKSKKINENSGIPSKLMLWFQEISLFQRISFEQTNFSMSGFRMTQVQYSDVHSMLNEIHNKQQYMRYA